MADAPERHIASEQLCVLTGLTDRRHRQLAKDGWFSPPIKGQYILVPTLQGLFRYYRERGDAESPRGALLKAQQIGQDLRNRLREMEVRTASSALVPIDEAHEVIRVAFEPLKTVLDTMPLSLAARIAGADTPEKSRLHLQAWATATRNMVAAALTKAAAPEPPKP